MLGAWLAVMLSSAVAGEDALDLLEVSYLKETSRAAEAIAIVTPWLTSHPDDARTWLRWIDLHAQSWTRDPVMLSATTRAWAEAHPDAPLRHAMAAEALAVAALRPGMLRFGDEFHPDAPGPWCDEAQAAVRELPAAPLDRVTVYDQQRRFAKACGWPETAYRHRGVGRRVRRAGLALPGRSRRGALHERVGGRRGQGRARL